MKKDFRTAYLNTLGFRGGAQLKTSLEAIFEHRVIGVAPSYQEAWDFVHEQRSIEYDDLKHAVNLVRKANIQDSFYNQWKDILKQYSIDSDEVVVSEAKEIAANGLAIIYHTKEQYFNFQNGLYYVGDNSSEGLPTFDNNNNNISTTTTPSKLSSTSTSSSSKGLISSFIPSSSTTTTTTNTVNNNITSPQKNQISDNIENNSNNNNLENNCNTDKNDKEKHLEQLIDEYSGNSSFTPQFEESLKSIAEVFCYVCENEVDAFWCFNNFLNRSFKQYGHKDIGIYHQINILSRLLELYDRPLWNHLNINSVHVDQFSSNYSKCPSNFITDNENNLCIGRESGINSIAFIECQYNGNSLYIIRENKNTSGDNWNPIQIISNSINQTISDNEICRDVFFGSGTRPEYPNDVKSVDLLQYRIVFTQCSTSTPEESKFHVQSTDQEKFEATSLCKYPMYTDFVPPFSANIQITDYKCLSNFICRISDTKDILQTLVPSDCSKINTPNELFDCNSIGEQGKNHLIFNQTLYIGGIKKFSSQCNVVCINGDCDSISKSLANECSNSKPCTLENSECITTSEGSSKCVCKKGFEMDGETKQCKDINECEKGTHSCVEGTTTCVNTPGSFQCQCNKSGYKLVKDTCVDIDECSEYLNYTATKTPPCKLEFSTCINNDGGYTCKCHDGFTQNGNDCVDVDECQNSTLSNCPENTQCVNMIGSFAQNTDTNTLLDFPQFFNIRHTKKGILRMNFKSSQNNLLSNNNNQITIQIGNIPCTDISQYQDTTSQPNIEQTDSVLQCKFEIGQNLNEKGIKVSIGNSSKVVSLFGAPFIKSISHPLPTKGGDVILNVVASQYPKLEGQNISLTIGEYKCDKLSFTAIDQIKCTMPPGTGIKSIYLYVNGDISTDTIDFTYKPPTIESVTSTNAKGGQITIKGSNFGDQISSIQVLIDNSISCDNPTFLEPHSTIVCDSPSSSLQVFSKIVNVIVDNIYSTAPINIFYEQEYNCSRSITCMNRGNCIFGLCNCEYGFLGPHCEFGEHEIFGPKIVTSPDTPTSTLDSNNGTSFKLNIIEIREDSPISSEPIVNYPIDSITWNITTITPDYHWKYTSVLDNGAYISIDLYQSPETKDVVMGSDGEEIKLSMVKGSLKYTIYIEAWPFKNRINYLSILFESATIVKDSTGNVITQKSCSTKSQHEIGYSNDSEKDESDDVDQSSSSEMITPNDNIESRNDHPTSIRSPSSSYGNEIVWFKVRNQYLTLLARFLNQGILDGQVRPIKFRKVKSDDTVGSILVALSIPSFTSSALVDPDYTVLFSNKPYVDESCESVNTFDKWVTPSAILIAGIIGTATIGSVAWYIIRKRRQAKLPLLPQQQPPQSSP
eukprot:gene1955-2392_t